MENLTKTYGTLDSSTNHWRSLSDWQNSDGGGGHTLLLLCHRSIIVMGWRR